MTHRFVYLLDSSAKALPHQNDSPNSVFITQSLSNTLLVGISSRKKHGQTRSAKALPIAVKLRGISQEARKGLNVSSRE